MLSLLPALREQFDGLQDRYVVFAELGVQVEGWFKGELLTLLRRLAAEGAISDLDREVPVGRGKIDLSFSHDGLRHFVELKHWLIGYQKGTRWAPSSYLSDRSSIGIVPDIDKLRSLPDSTAKWLLLFLTANPGESDWQKGLVQFHAKFQPRQLTAITTPNDFPSSYYMAILAIASG